MTINSQFFRLERFWTTCDQYEKQCNILQNIFFHAQVKKQTPMLYFTHFPFCCYSFIFSSTSLLLHVILAIVLCYFVILLLYLFILLDFLFIFEIFY